MAFQGEARLILKLDMRMHRWMTKVGPTLESATWGSSAISIAVLRDRSLYCRDIDRRAVCNCVLQCSLLFLVLFVAQVATWGRTVVILRGSGC